MSVVLCCFWGVQFLKKETPSWIYVLFDSARLESSFDLTSESGSKEIHTSCPKIIPRSAKQNGEEDQKSGFASVGQHARPRETNTYIYIYI